MSKQQIMCDYDDSVLTRGRLESHLGSSYDSNRLLLIMSWMARKGQPHFLHFPFSYMRLRNIFKKLYILHTSTYHLATRVLSYVKQHFQTVVCFSSFYAPQGSCSKWPSFLTFTDISNLMRLKSSHLDD